ncbi:hypothetical protein FQN57_001040 [Myotisia sp. PD_48]|nr:hypothetical protein FQN57_001040 [Myotisia sp. PD_48]
MANIPNSTNTETVQRALETARNSEGDEIDTTVSAILEAAINELWRKIGLQPNSYILTRQEFSLFNYFRDRFRNSLVAQQAVERFWNNFRGEPSDIDGYL